MMGIAVGLSSSMFKEMVISSIARDSQIAFYEADTAVECMLYADKPNDYTQSLVQIVDPAGSGTSTQGTFNCGVDSNGTPMTLTVIQTMSDYYTITPSPLLPKSEACFKATVDQTGGTTTALTIRGYNVCDSNNPRQVERGVQVLY